MPRLALVGGVGATGTAMVRFFHPSAKIREKWPQNDKRRLFGVLVTGEGIRKVQHKNQMCYLVRIPEIDDSTIFHIVKKNFKVLSAPAVPFESESPNVPVVPAPVTGEALNPDRIADRNVVPNIEGLSHRDSLRGDIDEQRRQGITVDDDNDPLPENTAPQSPAARMYETGTWTTPRACCRRTDGFVYPEGKFVNKRWDQIADMSELDLFRLCFPEKYIVKVLIPETNKNLTKKNIDLQEFYVFLGCIFFMSCFVGIDNRADWWSTAPIDMMSGAPFRLNSFMTRKRFDEIMSALTYTNKVAPLMFVDRFHEVRQMINAFNDHYATEYSPSWLSCIDESMNVWLNKFCPGFMSLPRKPHPFGNEYHSIADGDKGRFVMWRIRLVEGKDRPKLPNGQWAFPSKFEKKGYNKTVDLLLDMTEPIHRTGKVVTGDSGFCVTAGVMALHAHGVFGQFLIKKRRYWPQQVPGDQIDEYMKGKELGAVESFVQDLGGTPFYIHCCRDADYVTKIMSTHGTLDEVEGHSTWRCVNGEWKSFRYAEPFSRHNKGKHWVDDVNNRRHDPIALDSTWKTKWWPNRQFTFLMSIAEVNAGQVRARAKDENPDPTLTFRRKLAIQMMANKIQGNGVVAASPPRRPSRRSIEHVLTKRKRKEGKWNPYTRRFNETKTVYVPRPCSDCGKNTRSYCPCDPGRDLCGVCFGKHLQEHAG